MRVVREELLSVLEVVKYGLSKRETIEQSSRFVFQGGRVSAFNDEVYCTAPSPLGDYEGAVLAGELLETLRDLDDETLEVSAPSGHLSFRGRRERFRVHAEGEILLRVDRSASVPDSWDPLPENFLDALSLAAPHAGTDANEYALTCVHITPKFIEACDNYRLLRYRLDTGLPEAVLVRGESVRNLPNLGMAEVSLATAWLFFRSPKDVVYGCRRHEADYPDLSAFLRMGAADELALPKDLGDFVKRASRFSRTSIEDDLVRVDLSRDGVRVVGEGPTGGYSGSKGARYRGRPVSFYIAPKVLAGLVKDHQECEVTGDRLRIVGDRWKYVVRLCQANGNGNGHGNGECGEGG